MTSSIEVILKPMEKKKVNLCRVDFEIENKMIIKKEVRIEIK